jgi:GH24 family phage-related lysozyme (muramidase)
MSLSLDEIKQHMVPFEGCVPHMYLDTVGKVTVAIGNLLANVESAKALRFVVRATGAAASPTEIVADFNAVLQQPKGQFHGKYKESTRLDLPDVDIDALFKVRVATFEQELRGYYARYDVFPDKAKLAILDMAFNLGSAGLKKTWPNLNRAIDNQDWSAAAKHCVRPMAQPRRNSGTVALFEGAANDSQVLVGHGTTV